MERRATGFAHHHAKRMRKDMTDAERHLWHRLRRNQLGARFRRQHPLGSFIADFACLDPKLVIEVDGSQHMQQVERDEMRDAFFRAEGFLVLHFQANQVLAETHAVLTILFDAIERMRSSMKPNP